MRAVMTTSSRLPAALRALAACLLCTLVAASPALAGGLEKAEAALGAGRADDARTALLAWFDGDAVDAAGLLRAAFVARGLEDRNVLGAVRAAAERVEEQAGRAVSEPLHLALGFAYLSIAEAHLKQRSGGSSVSLLFADALARSSIVAVGGPLGSTALHLAAATHYAKGDATAALHAIESRSHELAGQPGARLLALQGLLLYERGVAGGTDASARPTKSAAADFEAAIAALGAAIDANTLRGRELQKAHLQHAYAHHRMGNYDPAIRGYHAAHAGGGREGLLALRGLHSLLGRDPERLAAELDTLVRGHPEDAAAVDLLVQVHLGAGNVAAALLVARRHCERNPDDRTALYLVGHVLQRGGMLRSARRYFVEVLKRSPDDLRASQALEQLARDCLGKPRERAVALQIYDELLQLRPNSPYIRNNYGFILRDLVTPHTALERGGIQRLKPGATDEVRRLLTRCVEVYAEAAALIDPAEDGSREELEAWNLAGIVNDYGLILHYFIDVQDASLAEKQYLRALRMTDYGFKDTYSPNLHRLYRHVLTDRTWRWYRIAREAKDAILREARDENGRLALVADEQKREAARRDMEAARARILQTLKMDADEDGISPPVDKENGNDR